MQPGTDVQVENQRAKSFGKKVKGKLAALFQKHRKKKIAALILICLAVIISQSLGSREQGIAVGTGEVVESSFEQNVLATGKLAVNDEQKFYADSKTKISEILVTAGQNVKKGQVVLRTDDSGLAVEVAQNRLACDDIRAKLVSSESNLRLYQQDYDSAQAVYETNQLLFQDGAISRQECDDSEKERNAAQEKLLVERDANYPLLKAQLAQAELVYNESLARLEKATVVSPLDGVVLNLPVQKGQEVEAGALLAQIGNPDRLQIETGLNEIDAAQLKTGDPVEISNNTLLAVPLKGSVEYISPVAEVVTTAQGEQTQVKIRIAVAPGQGADRLKPGFNVNLKVILQQKAKATLVPLEAVVQSAGKNLVYVVGQDGIVAAREVQVGLSNELFTEISSGLQVGEKVVLSPGEQIKDGVKVIADAASK
jgi:HlyD family secretion protein